MRHRGSDQIMTMASPVPVASSPRIRTYRKPSTPAGGEPVRPHSDARILDSNYINGSMDIPDLQDGYAPELHIGTTSTPDDIRIGRRKRPPHANEPRWVSLQTHDFLTKYQEQLQISTGWQIEQHRDPVPMSVPDSREYLPIRPTATLGPNTYLFKRYWPVPVQSSGEHLSLADHRRKYEIFGMRPQGRIGVNTYRLDPQPWDQTLYPQPPLETQAMATSHAGISGNASYRARGGVKL